MALVSHATTNEGREIILRPLRRADIPAAFQMSARAGWNQTEEDWQILLDLAPQTCFGVEIRGELASTTTLICYGQRLGWIGMVLTKLEFQRRGLARRLLDHTLNVADEMGIETLKLDATDQGQPLYLRCGFLGEQEIERWSRTGKATGHFPEVGSSLPGWSEQDRKYFGADRSPLLERLARRNAPLIKGQSYLLARPGRASAYLGPCVSDNPEDARSLSSTCVENAGGRWYWDLLPANRNAVGIASDLGFTPQRQLLRMARGKQLKQNVDSTYAIAGFELG